MEKNKTLQNNILQWTDMQNELLDQCMAGVISKEEYKERNNILSEDIGAFKKEIHELSLSLKKERRIKMGKDLMRNFSFSIYQRTRERYLEFKKKHELTHDEAINLLLDTHERAEEEND